MAWERAVVLAAFIVVVLVAGGWALDVPLPPVGGVLLPDEPITVTHPMDSTLSFPVDDLLPSSYYEIRISYPAINPTQFKMEWMSQEEGAALRRRLLNTEKIMFSTDEEGRILGREDLTAHVLTVTTKNEGVTVYAFLDNRNVVYNIVLETLFYGVPYAVFRIGAIAAVALGLIYWQLPRIYDMVTSTDRKRT